MNSTLSKAPAGRVPAGALEDAARDLLARIGGDAVRDLRLTFHGLAADLGYRADALCNAVAGPGVLPPARGRARARAAAFREVAREIQAAIREDIRP